jgi:pimeloyl-ACP methyl ester carboxylesterase
VQDTRATGQTVQSGWVVVSQVRAMRETVYGVRTHYVHAGQGEPVVLVHGGAPGASGASGWWQHTVEALSERYHVYALDLIGSGYTDRPGIEYSIQTLVEHLASFVDALALEGVRLVGNSLGAYVAIKYALDHPARVQQAALISTATLAKACGVGDGGKAMPLPVFDGSRDSVRGYLEVLINDPAQLSDERLETHFRIASLPGHREYMQSIARYRRLTDEDPSQRQVFDVRARLPLLDIPWCLIWAADDRLAPLDPMGRGMQALVPHVPFHVVERSGHVIQIDQPDACNRLLLEFFDRNGQLGTAGPNRR